MKEEDLIAVMESLYVIKVYQGASMDLVGPAIVAVAELAKEHGREERWVTGSILEMDRKLFSSLGDLSGQFLYNTVKDVFSK